MTAGSDHTEAFTMEWSAAGPREFLNVRVSTLRKLGSQMTRDAARDYLHLRARKEAFALTPAS